MSAGSVSLQPKTGSLAGFFKTTGSAKSQVIRPSSLAIASVRVSGNRITVVPGRVLSRFVKGEFWVEYDDTIDLSSIPPEILALPFYANIAPVVWASNQKIAVERMDSVFAAALQKVRASLKNLYPSLSWSGELFAENYVQTKPKNEGHSDRNTAVLFSGGLDSTFSSLLHHAEPQTLITLHGNDIDLSNHSGWSALKVRTTQFATNWGHNYSFVRSNLRSFLREDTLVKLSPQLVSWWGSVQHGLGLTGIAAPILWHKGIERLLVPGTHTPDYAGAWGSHPTIDNNIAWSNTTVEHDGYHFSRQSKIQHIKKWCKELIMTTPKLRVCCSVAKTDQVGNCCSCEKCLRTALGILLEGEEIGEYGFGVPASHIFDEIRTRFIDRSFLVNLGSLSFWWTNLQHRAIEIADNQECDSQECGKKTELSWKPSKELQTFVDWFSLFPLREYKPSFRHGVLPAMVRKGRKRLML